MQSRAARGFTLLELLVAVVVLALVGSLAGLAAPDRAEQSLDLAQVQIDDALARARSLARSQRLAFGVVFDPAGNRFALVDESGVPTIHPLTRGEYVVDFLRPGQPLVDVVSADFGDAGAAALFDPQGTPLAGGVLEIAARQHSRTLVVDAGTGQLSAP